MAFNILGKMGQTRRDAQAARESIKRQMEYEADQRARRSAEEAGRVAAIRVLTGDLKHRYAIIEPLQGFGYYTAEPGRNYDPTEATRRAIHSLQRQAFAIGADAVIHARFEILRYLEQSSGGFGGFRRNNLQNLLPAYEAHAFGTAVKIVGPPRDWDSNSE